MDPSSDDGKIDRLRRAIYSRTLSGNIKPRQRRTFDEEKEYVGENWRSVDPGVPAATIAPRGIMLARNILWWILVLAVIFFIGSVGFFGYYFMFGGGSLSASANNIDIAVSGPPQVSSGQSTELQIAITNRNRAPLELSSLVITFPDGTRSVTDFKTALPSMREDLGEIKSGETRQGVVNAVFFGTAGAHANVKVELDYHLSGSNAIFVASTDYSIVFGSSPLSISVNGNTQTVSGQPVQFTVNVASNANATVRDALLQVRYPFGFKLTSATPAPASDGLWTLGDLVPGASRTVSINGILLGQPGDDRTFDFTAGTRDSTSSTSITNTLANNPFDVAISQSFLGLAITATGESSNGTTAVSNPQTSSIGGGIASSTEIIVKPGDVVNVTINYQNNLSTAITDAVIIARLSGLGIDGSTVHSSDGFYRSADTVMYWDKTTTGGALADLAAGAKGSVEFSFQMPNSDVLKNVLNPYLDISVSAAGNRISQTGVPQNLQSTAQQRIALASDLQLFAQGLYYQNPFGVSGPIPPQANVETDYAIVFTVRNTTNAITNAKLTAALPPYARWLGSHAPASENLSFNQDSSTFTWDIGTIEPNTGLNGSSPLQMAVSIGFTPSESQIGDQPSLIGNITLTGTDAATGAPVTLTTPDVTTNLTKIAPSAGASSAGMGTDHGFDPTNAEVVK